LINDKEGDGNAEGAEESALIVINEGDPISIKAKYERQLA